MDMSESLEIVEITDSSILPDALAELDDKLPELDFTTKTKRPLSEPNLDDERSAKKICAEIDDRIADETNENENVIDDTSVNESKAADDGENEFNEPDILEQNIASELEAQPNEEILIEEVLTKELESTVEHEDEAEDEEEEEDPDPDEDEIGADDSIDFHDSESENSSAEEVDDDEMMARAIRATAQHRGLQPKPAFQISNDEPIALDDTDEDEEPPQNARQEKYQSDNERSSEYSVDNNVLGESEAEEEEDEEPRFSRPKILNSKVLLARRLVKNSFKVLRTKRDGLRKVMAARAASIKKHAKEQEQESIVPVKVDKPAEEKLDLASATIATPTAKLLPSETLAMDISTEEPKKSPLQEVPSIPEQKEGEVVKTSETSSKTPVENNEAPTIPATTGKTSEESDEKVNEKSSGENSNESSHHDSSLLTEITNCSLDEIFNRYVHKNNDQSPTLDEFQEELFYCLQQNNQEIEKAKLLWNERLHVKYKIRELMETIRRHRAVMEIETFGFKPENAGNNSHPVISSKSSTTTNSETDHFEKNFRMSTESVSRLIQDVRATILKRDEKQRTDDLSANNAGDNSLASQWNNLQSNSAQGRQGQIIDVQSIINDFRQKNPQEIPRRGRRMKNSFGNNYFDNPQSQIDESRAMRSEFMSNVTNNSHDFNSTMKSSQSQGGYPEVSLHPVQNLYKNLANASGASGSGVGHFGGQKSSLLQSILTKQSTKSPVGFHQNHASPTTSTLARLLTAPERSFQGPPKHTNQAPPRQSSTKSHNNGEITITPIGMNNPRNKDFSMEDDENSIEPPLVIDETEDFEASMKSVTDLLCQGCSQKKALFMCAGCSRQWYCSKDCQERAWDEHAEQCMI